MERPLLTVELRFEHDLVLARQRARQIAELLGFDGQDQNRITTAVSEIARNAFQYAGGGRIDFSIAQAEPAALLVRISDRGPGIDQLEQVISGRYRSRTGMGQGIAGSRRLMDRFELDSRPGDGTTVTLGKHFSPRMPAPTEALLTRLSAELAQRHTGGAMQEIQQQNQELLAALEALRQKNEELDQANLELEETNRGVLALYAELDARADYLQRATEIKSRFLSNMTHEFRTPLNSILSLSQILLQRLDGPLSDEQEKQITYIQQSAESLSELVNDLLDLAKAEAGKLTVRPGDFNVADLFGALRGMLRPLLVHNTDTNLVFEEPEAALALHTDEAKVSQILRNFISNAIKYTEAGEIRVWAQRGPGDSIVFAVADTGIGIAAEDQERIFEEFSQVESQLQRRVKGTGLGLPLSRKLAQLLGGDVHLESQPGVGSTFYAVIPARFGGTDALPPAAANRTPDAERAPILLVEGDSETLQTYQHHLAAAGFEPIAARSIEEARRWLANLRPAAMVMDILLEGEHTWDFLRELKQDARRATIPVLVATPVENERRARALGADDFQRKPVAPAQLLARLRTLISGEDAVLVIDDDEIARYLLRGLLAEAGRRTIEAPSAAQGLALARGQRPAAIFLDLVMPEADGFTTLERLKADPALADIPVIIHTSKPLDDAERERLSAAVAVLTKNTASHEQALAAVRAALAKAGLSFEAAGEQV